MCAVRGVRRARSLIATWGWGGEDYVMISIRKYRISGGCGDGILAESLKCEDASFSNKFTPCDKDISQTGESPVQDQLTNPGNRRRWLVHPGQFTKQTHVVYY